MQKLKMSIKILVISIAKPILIGIYEDNKLIKTISEDGKTSDILPVVFDMILQKYQPTEFLYVNSPGSFMAIKVAYIFLKTLSITNDITLKAVDGFIFNKNSPIKALGKKYFFKDKNNNIYLDFLDDNTKIEEFNLPKILDENIGSYDTLPNYHLPAVS